MFYQAPYAINKNEIQKNSAIGKKHHRYDLFNCAVIHLLQLLKGKNVLTQTYYKEFLIQ